MKSFPFSMTLEDDRGYIWVRKALRCHEHGCMLYATMSLKVVGKIHFPHERDEFDGIQQRKAIEHLAVLRLSKGNVERLEHFFTAINASELQTSGADWALHILMPFSLRDISLESVAGDVAFLMDASLLSPRPTLTRSHGHGSCWPTCGAGGGFDGGFRGEAAEG